jgi:GMP synthase (glutamine-hydrolysing)
MTDLPYLILDCYFDERGAAPNIRHLLGEAESETIRAVWDPIPGELDSYSGVIITGSKACLSSPEPWMGPLLEKIREIRSIEMPLLGLCFGHQAIAAALHGEAGVRLAPRGELGWESISVLSSNPILEGLPAEFTCFLSHFDEVTPGLPGMDVIARSSRCEVQAYQISGEPIWGLQFHPEMDPEECEILVKRNLERHESLGNDHEEILANRRDGRDLGALIFSSFMRFCTAARD